MALIECSECSGRVSSQAVACPHCGAPLGSKRQKPERAKTPLWQYLVFGGLVLVGVSTCMVDAPEKAADAGLSDGDAAYLCAQAIRSASRDAERAEVPTVLPVREGQELRFTWSNSTKLLRLRNGLGVEVAATGSCVVDREGRRITELTVSGVRLI